MTQYETDDYIRGCIQSCQGKGHIQQVAFSTFHNALTQICFTCEAVRTSINHQEIIGSKKATPLSHFKDTNNQIGCGKMLTPFKMNCGFTTINGLTALCDECRKEKKI